MNFVKRYHNKFVKYYIRNLINELDTNNLLNDQKITEVNIDSGKLIDNVFNIYQQGKNENKIESKKRYDFVKHERWSTNDWSVFVYRYNFVVHGTNYG